MSATNGVSNVDVHAVGGTRADSSNDGGHSADSSNAFGAATSRANTAGIDAGGAGPDDASVSGGTSSEDASTGLATSGNANSTVLTSSGGASHVVLTSSGGASRDTDVTAGGAGGNGCVLGSFSSPEKVTGLDINSSRPQDYYGPALSADGLTLYVGVSGSGSNEGICVATRSELGAGFGPASRLAGVNSTSNDGSPNLSFDGLTLYFQSDRSLRASGCDLWLATRSELDSDFDRTSQISGANSTDDDLFPWVSRDELTLLFASTRTGQRTTDLFVATRASRTSDFSSPARLPGINTEADEKRAVLSSNALTIIFASDRVGGEGKLDLWSAHRSSADSEFTDPINLTQLNTSSLDVDPALSADDRELYFASTRDGKGEIWRSVRECE